MSLFVTGRRILLNSSQSEPQPATIRISRSSGKIAAVQLGIAAAENGPDDLVIDAGDHLVMAGIVDAHVHINEPGRTEWEGFATATCAAAAGGCTTIVDMPLNAIPPTTTVENLTIKRKAAEGQLYVDVGYYGGIIPDNQASLLPLVKAGVRGFKCFMIESGVDEFPHVNELQICRALETLQSVPSQETFVMFHAEMCSDTTTASQSIDGPPQAYSSFLHSRPPVWETGAVDLVIKVCKKYNTRCHIVHLSAADCLPSIRAAKKAGLPLTVETCFHYLFFEAGSIPDNATHYKCCPPIRDARNRDQLWGAVLDGTIDYVVSDHSPCTANLKLLESGDFMRAWGGIASVQFGLSAIWTAGRERGLSYQHIARLLCENTAKQVGLGMKKGRLEVGYDGDIVIWDPEAEFTIGKPDILFKNKISPYEDINLRGRVVTTILRGEIVYSLSHGVGRKTLRGRSL